MTVNLKELSERIHDSILFQVENHPAIRSIELVIKVLRHLHPILYEHEYYQIILRGMIRRRRNHRIRIYQS